MDNETEQKLFEHLSRQIMRTKNLVKNYINDNDPFESLSTENSIRIQVINNSPNKIFKLKINNKKIISFLDYRKSSPVIKTPNHLKLSLYIEEQEIILDEKYTDLNLDPDNDYLLLINGINNNKSSFPLEILPKKTSFSLGNNNNFGFTFFNGFYSSENQNIEINITIKNKNENKNFQLFNKNFSETIYFENKSIDNFVINYLVDQNININTDWITYMFFKKPTFIFFSGLEKDYKIFAVFTDGTVILIPNQSVETIKEETENIIMEVKPIEHNISINESNLFQTNNINIENSEIKYISPVVSSQPANLSFLYYGENPKISYNTIFNDDKYFKEIYFKLHIIEEKKKVFFEYSKSYLNLNINSKNPIEIILGNEWFFNVDPLFTVEFYVTWNIENIFSYIFKKNKDASIEDIKKHLNNYYEDKENSEIEKTNIYIRKKNTQNFISKDNFIDILGNFYEIFRHYIDSSNTNKAIFMKLCTTKIYISILQQDLESVNTVDEEKQFKIEVSDQNQIEFGIKYNTLCFENNTNLKLFKSRENGYLSFCSEVYQRKIDDLPVLIKFMGITKKYIHSISISKNYLPDVFKKLENTTLYKYFNNWLKTKNSNQEIFKIYGLNTRNK